MTYNVFVGTLNLAQLNSLYVAPVSDLATAHHVSIYQYADDIQSYIAFLSRS